MVEVTQAKPATRQAQPAQPVDQPIRVKQRQQISQSEIRMDISMDSSKAPKYEGPVAKSESLLWEMLVNEQDLKTL